MKMETLYVSKNILFCRILCIHFGVRHLQMYLLANYFLIIDTCNFVIIELAMFIRVLTTNLFDEKMLKIKCILYIFVSCAVYIY